MANLTDGSGVIPRFLYWLLGSDWKTTVAHGVGGISLFAAWIVANCPQCTSWLPPDWRETVGALLALIGGGGVVIGGRLTTSAKS